MREAGSGAHIATASSTVRSGRSQAASASALGRIAGIRSWTGATTSFGVVVTIVLGLFPQPILDLAGKAAHLTT